MKRPSERRFGPLGAFPERRGSIRFPLSLEVHYSVSDPDMPRQSGSGRIIDLSSSGLSFIADEPLPAGLLLKLSIDWPVLLEGGVRLQFIVSGAVVRSSGTTIAMRIEQHEFRTGRAGMKVVTRRESAG